MAAKNQLPDVWRSGRNIWNPVREMSRLQRRLDRVFDEFFNEPFPSVFGPTRTFYEALPMLAEEFTPAVDVEETDTHYLIDFDLPGVKKEDVRIEVRDNQLMVSGERKEERKERISRERYYGTFVRTFAFPPNVSADQVEASFENGVLQISIPKKEASKGKQIPIKEGKLIEAKSEKEAIPEKQGKAEKEAKAA